MSKAVILLACHNHGAYLEAALRSLTVQTFTSWECLVINDGSTDDSLNIAKNFALTDSRITVIDKINTGKSSSLNIGLKRLPPSCRYVMVLDADDCLEPRFLEIMSRYLDEHPEVGLVGCQFTHISEAGDRIGDGHRSRYIPAFPLPRDLKPEENATPFVSFFAATGQGPFALYRRSVLEKTGGWDEQFANLEVFGHEDSDMFCRMALLAPVHYLPDRLYLKRDHPLNSTKVGNNNSYGLFRQKWDQYKASNSQEARLVQDARNYYYRIHVPLRHLKVSGRCLISFFRTRELHYLIFSLQCFANSFMQAAVGPPRVTTTAHTLPVSEDDS